jgi:hypothetical protein
MSSATLVTELPIVNEYREWLPPEIEVRRGLMRRDDHEAEYLAFWHAEAKKCVFILASSVQLQKNTIDHISQSLMQAAAKSAVKAA